MHIPLIIMNVHQEQVKNLKNNARPQILDPLESIDEYDTIYLGFPKMEYSL